MPAPKCWRWLWKNIQFNIKKRYKALKIIKPIPFFITIKILLIRQALVFVLYLDTLFSHVERLGSFITGNNISLHDIAALYQIGLLSTVASFKSQYTKPVYSSSFILCSILSNNNSFFFIECLFHIFVYLIVICTVYGFMVWFINCWYLVFLTLLF